MKKLLVFLLSLLSLSVSAQRVKMAVYSLGNDSQNELVKNYLISEFTASGNYSVVERTPQFLNALQRELSYQRSGLVDEEAISEIGKQFGIRYICISEVYNVKDVQCITVRMVDAETATQVGNYYQYAIDSRYLDKIATQVKEYLDAQMKNSNQSAKKVAVYVHDYNKTMYAKEIENQLSFQVFHTKKYKLVERSSRVGRTLMSELRYQQSGNVKDNDIINAGKQTGADYVCVARILNDGKESYINTRLIEVESAEIQGTSINRFDTSSGASIIGSIMASCGLIHGETATETYEKKEALKTKRDNLQNYLALAMQNPTQQSEKWKYKGCMLKDLQYGMGVLTTENGVYAGKWNNGDFNGEGIYAVTSNETERFVKNSEGSAKMYVGGWSNGEKNGVGKFYNEDGNMIYYGEFKDDVPVKEYLDSLDYDCRFEILELPDSSIYVGETKKGLMNGLGLYIWRNGDMQYGEWRNGSADGKCIYIHADGYHEKCIKKGNTIVSDENFIDLGLSSGTKWATKCEGSGFTTFNEAVMTAYMTYGETAISEMMIPSIDLWEELLEECTWEWKTDCYWVKGPNGNGIYIYDFNLIRDYTGKRKPHDKDGCFWTINTVNDELVWTFSFSKDYKTFSKRLKNKKSGLHLVRQY